MTKATPEQVVAFMTDIVERLRKQAEDNLDPGNALVREAADEIDRLTDEVDQLTGGKAALQTEIERLRELNDDQQSENEQMQATMDRWWTALLLVRETTIAATKPALEQREP